MITTFEIPNENAMYELAARFKLREGIIYLYGNLGAGKTTLVRGFLRSLGYAHIVKSPTYTLVEEYQFSDQLVFHFDLYRLNDPKEVAFIGFEDYLQKNAICFIEWPEKGEGMLPPPDLSCYIEIEKVGRTVKLNAHSALGKEILKRI